VIGSFHGCVDFPLVARWIFMSFFELFSSVFRARLVPSILRCLSSDLLVGERPIRRSDRGSEWEPIKILPGG
jgi:hypothetical protein